MKKTIKDYDLKNKKVIIRVDFNVPIKDNKILDDSRIKRSLDTIKYAIENDAKVILLSHLGRIKTIEDKENNSLKIVAECLSNYLNKQVIFVNETRGKLLEEKIANMNNKDVLLIENTRFEDLDNKKESSNDSELAKYWASLGDIFINDAFGTIHRSHASNVGIANILPSGIGFLVEKELKELNIDDKPVSIILGGSKVNDKINLIKNLVKKADYLLIGGGMAFTFLKAKGFNIGNSLLDEENIIFCKEILENYNHKIILPIDVVIDNKKTILVEDFKDEKGLDIGIKTVELFNKYLEKSNTIFWNGPVGMYEEKPFDNGTKEICECLKKLDCKKIIGGGDTASAINNLGYASSMTYISTGGGATLEYLEGKVLPGVECINEK